ELDRVEGSGLTRLVEHREEHAREQLHHEHDQREHPEDVPDGEVLRRVVPRELAGDELLDRKTRVDPRLQTTLRHGRRWRGTGRGHCSWRWSGHHAAPSLAFASSTPTTSVFSSLNE